MNRGFVHIIPLVFIAVLVVGSLSIVSNKQEEKQKKAVGMVLSSSDDDEDDDNQSGSSGSGSSGSSQSESAKKQEEEQKEAEKKAEEARKGSKSGSSGKVKIESRGGNTKTKVETENGKSEIEIESSDGAKFKSKVEDDGKSETKIRFGNLRIEIKVENGRVVTKVKNENDEEVELEDDEEDELFEEFEDELEDDDIELATGSAQLGFIQKGNKVRTNFPLSVNPQTGELFVSTPAGEKVVAILPDVAIANMIAAGIITRTETPQTPPAVEPPGGTPSATSSSIVVPTVEGAAIGLEEFEGKIVYKIDGVKDEKFAGFVPVSIKVKAIVSAENGELVDINQGFLTRLLDILSF